MHIIVYGTLKSGYGNNRLLSNSRKVADCIVRGYKLYNYGFPVAAPDADSQIVGEVWEIEPEKTLSSLDFLEGCQGEGIENRGMYYRQRVVAFTDEGQIEGQMYVGHPDSWKNYEHMRECPIDETVGAYRWERY